MLGLLLSATGLAVVVAPAHAALVNPGFEAGLTGWSTDSTNVSTVTSAFGITPPEGTFQALISTEEGSPGASPKITSDIESFLGLSSSPFTYETGYTPLSFTLLGGTGTYTIGFGVMHVGDDQVDSGLLVDKLILTTNPVPEPSTVVLLASGLAGLGYWRRKQLLAVKY